MCLVTRRGLLWPEWSEVGYGPLFYFYFLLIDSKRGGSTDRMHRMESAGLTAGGSRRVSMCIRLVSPSGFGLLFQIGVIFFVSGIVLPLNFF